MSNSTVLRTDNDVEWSSITAPNEYDTSILDIGVKQYGWLLANKKLISFKTFADMIAVNYKSSESVEVVRVLKKHNDFEKFRVAVRKEEEALNELEHLK